MSIEDRLSDALHERLVLQFVERTRSVSLGSKGTSSNRLSRGVSPFAALLDQYVTKEKSSTQAPTLELAEAIINAPHEHFRVDPVGVISHNGIRMAALEAGTDLLHPNVRLMLNFEPGPGTRSRLTRRLLAFGRDIAETLVAPLRPRAASQLTPAARGFVYQLEQNLGTLWVEQSRDQLQAMTNRDRQLLTSFGVHVGRHLAYIHRTLLPGPVNERAALATAYYALQFMFKGIPLGAASFELTDNTPRPWLACVGYAAIGSLAVRVDHYEYVSSELGRLAKTRNFAFPRQLVLRLGCSVEQIAVLMRQIHFYQLPSGRFARTPSRTNPRLDPNTRLNQSYSGGDNYSRAARRPSE